MARIYICLTWVSCFLCGQGLAEVSSDVHADWTRQYQQIHRQVLSLSSLARNGQSADMASDGVFQSPASQALNRHALILDTDKSVLDVTIRRTEALLNQLKSMAGSPDVTTLEQRLYAVKAQANRAVPGDEPGLYLTLREVMREAAFDNPLLDFDRILFVEHGVVANIGGSEDDGNHLCNQYHGFNGRPGGRLCLLNDAFGPHPQVIDLVGDTPVQNGRLQGKSLAGGSFMSPELSWDGQTIYFAWSKGGGPKVWTEETCYHLFKINVDGTGLVQLTDGPYDDFDPCVLPTGRIAFISTRRGGYGRCHPIEKPTFTLHSMKDDGSDLFCLSFHETNEWHPSVDHHGMIVYTRWDYVDRSDMIAHHLWTCYPDGRDPRAPHGNYPLPLTTRTGSNWPAGWSLRPFAEFNIRVVPGSHKYMATAGPHHGESFGGLVMIDARLEDDNQMAQVKRITPDVRFPEGETGTHEYYPYGTAWPLSEAFYLVNYEDGIYVLDQFGNRELVYRSPDRLLRPIDPIPLRPRVMPPVIPTQTFQGERLTESAPNATISVMNVYVTDAFGRLPDGIKIKEMRIVQVFPKSTYAVNVPSVGYSESLARMALGTVPVEEDGSVYCEAPVAKDIYFQLLDANGMAVQSMRSDTYVHPGEQMTCLGCHEDKGTVPSIKPNPLAMRRAPSKIMPEVGGLEPVNFYRLVKPVFECKCTPCHTQKGGPNMSYASLNGRNEPNDLTYGYPGNSHVLFQLARFGGSRTVPGQTGAHASRLYREGYLDVSHYKVNLTREELRRITLWLDLNSNELGAYTQVDAQKRGELVWPKLDVDPGDPLGVEQRVGAMTMTPIKAVSPLFHLSMDSALEFRKRM